MSNKPGLTVLAGPTAVGKGTVSTYIRDNYPEVWLSVSATTRAPRPGEIDGVHYFFKSKDGLFVAAMQLPLRPADVLPPVLAEGLPGLGERIVRRLLSVWDDPANRNALLATVQGASAHPGAAAALREFVRREVVGRVADVIEADRPQLRANLVASQVIGLLGARYVVRVEPLASMDAEELVPLIGPALQRYLDGRL